MKRNHLSWMALGTIAICTLAFLSTVFSVYTTSELTKQIDLMYENTYKVRSEVEAISSRLAEIRLILPTLLENDNTYQMERIYNMLKERDERQNDSIESIKANYLGPQDDIEQLIAAFTKLKKARLTAIDRLSGKIELKDITEYFNDKVDPYADAVKKILQQIESNADNHMEVTHKEADITQKVANTVAILLCVLIVGLVIITTRVEKHKNGEIKYREQLFDLISSNTEDVFYIYSCSAKTFEYVSRNSSRLLGIESREFYDEPRKLREFLIDEIPDDYDAIFENGTLSEIYECDLKYANKDKQLILKVRIYPVFELGKVRRYIVVLSDQTKVIEHQNILNDALLSAQRANAAKRDFLSRMSHEIRTPMNTIIGMTAIGLRHIDDLGYVENCLKKITFSSGHLLSLINDILDMSKIEDDKLAISHEIFDFRKLIESVTTIIYPQTAERKQNFEVTISGLTEEILIGDALRVNQVLLNILSNSVKFTPQGGKIEMNIAKIKSSINGQIRLRFTISDTGIGMNEEFMGRLFTPFEQADSTISQKYGGTGLGMSITKNLISLMNGTIMVSSQVNKGSVFTIELPFGINEDENTVYNQELTDLNVLVVDDDKNTCEHAMVLMEQIGINASWVCSGREAIEQVIKAHDNGEGYDVCFIDWCMPDMDGVETAKLIRNKLGPDTIIIIISAYDWSEIEKEAREVGVNAFVSKPIFASSISNTLNSMIVPKSLSKSTKTKKYDFKGKKIMLAEDNETNREIAGILLNDIGITVDNVENGKEALERFENSEVDEYTLILMDIQMPLMNGYDATRAIRKSNHERANSIPIIAMTANAFNEDIVAAKEAGMDGHLAKPIDIDLLYSTMDTYMK